MPDKAYVYITPHCSFKANTHSFKITFYYTAIFFNIIFLYLQLHVLHRMNIKLDLIFVGSIGLRGTIRWRKIVNEKMPTKGLKPTTPRFIVHVRPKILSFKLPETCPVYTRRCILWSHIHGTRTVALSRIPVKSMPDGGQRKKPSMLTLYRSGSSQSPTFLNVEFDELSTLSTPDTSPFSVTLVLLESFPVFMRILS